MTLYPLSPKLADLLASWVDRATDDEELLKYVLSVPEERREGNIGRTPDRRKVHSLAHLAASLTMGAPEDYAV